MNPDAVEGRNAARQTEILANNKRGQVFHMNIRADLAETLAGLWFGEEKHTGGGGFVVKSPAAELGETLNKHS